MAAGVALTPALLWMLERHRTAAILLAASLPLPLSLGGVGLGLSIAVSDVLLVLLFVVVVSQLLVSRDLRALQVLAPIRWPLGQYLAVIAVVWVAHLGFSALLQTVQRLELFLFALLVGAAIALRGDQIPVLRAYVLVTTVFAALYLPFSDGAGGLGVQKNPAGQFIANALLVLIAVKPTRHRLLWAVPVLTLGLFWTQSRGALLSVPIGLAVLMAMHRGGTRWRTAAMLVPLSLVAAGAFALLPDEAQQRNTSFDSGTQSRAAYSLKIRDDYREEAWAIIHARPWTGIGIGNYPQGVDGMRPSTVDPHQVLLLQAAEGGYPLAVSFVVLAIGCCLVMRSKRQLSALGGAAAAVLIGSIGHGLVDVYWVRGTPVLGWLLLGLALGATARRQAGGGRWDGRVTGCRQRAVGTVAGRGAGPLNLRLRIEPRRSRYRRRWIRGQHRSRQRHRSRRFL